LSLLSILNWNLQGFCLAREIVDGKVIMPRSVTLSFELLETVVALVRGGGEASAALKSLNINQPTLSKRLKYLQHSGPLLERPWVERRGRTWKLTEEGKRVWPAVLELVEGHENLQAFLRGAGGPLEDPMVRFACGQTMVAGLVREALREFRKTDHPTPLRISTMRGRARIEGVSNGSLDLAIVTHSEPAIQEIARRSLHVEPLVRHGLLLACATDSPWSRAVHDLSGDIVPVDAIWRFPLIVPEPDAGIRKSFDEALRRRGVLTRLNIALEIGGWGAILAYVRDGLGVGIVSQASIADAEGLILRPLDPEFFPPIGAKLIARRLAGSGESLDLSEPAKAWRAVLYQVARRGGGGGLVNAEVGLDHDFRSDFQAPPRPQPC
jgi:DNA-binding transcriptional LysR family regulator